MATNEVYVAGVRVDNLGTDQLSQMIVEWVQKKISAEVKALMLRRRLTALRQELYEKERELREAEKNEMEVTSELKILNSLYWGSRRGTDASVSG